jgi:NADPH:quinone reductase
MNVMIAPWSPADYSGRIDPNAFCPMWDTVIDEYGELTGGRGADVVYDAVGRDTFASSLDMRATRGVLACYGQSSGPPPPLDVSRLSGLTSGAGSGSLTVSFVSASHTAAERAGALRAVLDDLRAGRLTVRIAQRFPLRRAADAHRLLESRAVTGKLLLEA